MIRDFCEVCYAEVGEYCQPGEVALGAEDDLATMPVAPRPLLHPSVRFRFTDVVEELHAIAELASQAVEVEGSRLATACGRAESLLRILRLQFLDDIGIGDGQGRAIS